MSIAVNIADLTRYDTMIAGLLVAPVAPGKQIVNTDPSRVDEGAVILECEDERALAIVAILRLQDKKVKRYACRAYQQGPRGGWKKV